MSGIGSNACTLRLNSAGILTASGYNKFRHTLQLTLKDFSLATVPNPVFLLFRPETTLAASGTIIVDPITQVSTGKMFSQAGSDAEGSIETNTTPIAGVFVPANKPPIGEGVIRTFIMRLYNGDTTEKIGEGWIPLRGTGIVDFIGNLPTPPVGPGVNAKMG